ncbi:hypothetical protein D1631_08525 [Chryseobacterium nematophagum]|uniref:Thymidylate kinase-like domain-containing protein n=1 Tax=Chryseobacterium nematophagum TaxID=2305228 RepID=A0A3M7TG72_9FLAO|nr:hypothetical protein [Chryseobacterium nematophagum]RNA61976.1 hypothetical protein D1631_08525 [Chryseobacterium nematophagum]
MKNLFRNTGYKLFTQPQMGSKKISFSYIPNPDGSVRWFWNTNSQKPLFLKFYNASTVKAKLFSMFVKLIFILNLQKLIFKKEDVHYIAEDKNIFDIEGDWAIFTGTMGPNNKAILFCNDYFYKIADTENARILIHQELKNITYSGNSTFYSIPSARLCNDYVLQLSDISKNGKRRNEFRIVHARALQGIKDRFQKRAPIVEWEYFQNLKDNFKTIDDSRIPPNLMRKLNTILYDVNDNEIIDLSFSHGDFTPWNCYIKGETLAIYDWELASAGRPKGFDFFHFIIQDGILIQRNSWKKIFKEITDKNKLLFKFEENELNKYLKFYLLTNILNYLKIYSQQEEWHIQIHWLLKTWSEALNLFLTKNNTERELLVMDIFDHLYDQKYATLKFHNGEPEKLTLNSDIDMVISSRNAEKMIKFLKENSMVKKVTIAKKSFMCMVRVITHNQQILNLDLIQYLKWKNLEFLTAKEIMSHAEINKYGVKTASVKDTAKYLHFFYTLNGSKVPKKYKYMVEQNIPEKITKSETIKTLKQKKRNRGLSFFRNTLLYIKDSFYEKGFTITFSGVDGAGKSTVINEVSELIEKRYRRPVKVLRHRPSLLPILSVWTKGKEQAHENAVNSLPRQGKNKNYISSFLRFSYYYTDYIIGQFIIYFKYILRGKIVLYDRYYFDFIADSRRSNIQLPSYVAETGYHLLLKPKFNFFLYADPERILSRKRELSYDSICDLTTEYSKLFSKLDKQDQHVKYLSIENNDLDTTLDIIMNTIIETK